MQGGSKTPLPICLQGVRAWSCHGPRLDTLMAKAAGTVMFRMSAPTVVAPSTTRAPLENFSNGALVPLSCLHDEQRPVGRRGNDVAKRAVESTGADGLP